MNEPAIFLAVFFYIEKRTILILSARPVLLLFPLDLIRSWTRNQIETRPKLHLQGGDYTCLISDSPNEGKDKVKWVDNLELQTDVPNTENEKWIQKYVPQIRNTELREIELKSSLESLKSDMERLSCEVRGLRKDKQMLDAQLSIVKTEKKLHVEEHVRQKQQWEQEFKDISDRINAEKSQFKTELISINHHINKLQQELKSIKIKKKQQSDNYKRVRGM